MRIRVCSDLHVDVNKTLDFGFNEKINNVDLTIIAGDIAGDYQNEICYLSVLNTEKPVVCVGGNHLGYNYTLRGDRILDPFNGTKVDSIERLQKEFQGPIHYLENDHIIINNKIIFGGTMYTDFNLYGRQALSRQVAEQGMNDFRYVYTFDGENFRPVNSEDYISWFNLFINQLKETVKIAKEKDLDIIVVTHFAPSPKSISRKYMSTYKELNPAYCSDLEQFILNNSRIKLWCHGHMHDWFDYKIGQCRVVCAPYGYNHENNYEHKQYMGKVVRLG